MTVDPLVSLLIGAFGAAVLGTIGALLGAWIQSRREHLRWIRQERLTAYRDFIRIIEGVTAIHATAAERRKYQAEVDAARVALRLVGPDPVFRAATDHYRALEEWYKARTLLQSGELSRKKFDQASDEQSRTRVALTRVAQRALQIDNR